MSYQDEFDDPDTDTLLKKIYANLSDEPQPKKRRPVLIAALVIISVMALGVVIGISYPRGGAEQAADAVPIIRADARPFKVEPVEPGGMSVPYKDSTVFSSLSSGREGQGSSVENLLADDTQEDPMPKSQLFSGLNTAEDKQAQAPVDITENAAPKPAPVQTATKAPQALKPAPAVQQPKPVKVTEAPDDFFIAPETKKESAPIASIAKPRAKPNAPPTQLQPKTQKTLAAVREALNTEPAAGAAQPSGVYPTGLYYVQLSSLKTHVAAELEWRQLQKTYPAQLKSKAYRIQKADLGERGFYFRIQAGPFDKEYAQDLCSQIKSFNRGGCLVVGQ